MCGMEGTGMSEVFRLVDFGVVGNMMACINQKIADGEVPIVTISNKNMDRSQAQNKLMHKWFSEIDKSTGNGLMYEAGRCKYQYFLPILRISQSEEAVIASYTARKIEKMVGYERFLKVLGASVIGTTRFLTTQEFAEALTNMQIGEAEHNLTDPESRGFRI